MTRATFVSSVLLLAGVALVQGQSFSISQECQGALLGVAGSPEADCLNIGSLVQLMTISDSTSLIPTMNNWLEGACAASPCSDQALSDIVTNVTAGCSSDLASLGVPSISTSDIISAVQEAYPTVLQIGCLVDSTNNTLCATSLMDQVQGVIGQLSVDNIITEVSQGLGAGLSQLTSLPSFISCSDCVKEAYNILNQNEPEIATATVVTNALQSQCGASFLDGTSPGEILEGTGSAAPGATSASDTSGAASLAPFGAVMGASLSTLAAVFTAFVVLA